jgi:hypothetical protein
MDWKHHIRLAVNRDGVIARRDFLRGISAAGIAAGATSWTDALSLQAKELRRQGMSCILLWMPGGPSQFETLDPKPGHANGGETKAIDTAVSGIRISENLPQLAKAMNDVALIRSMTTKEGNHQRAAFLLHTSYAPTASVIHPTLGSVVSKQIRDSQCELPAFVRIGPRFVNSGSGGLLGREFDPFAVTSAGRMPNNAQPATDTDRYRRRLGLLGKLEASSTASEIPSQAEEHRHLYDKASQMILSPQMQAFDITKESDKVRDAYGKSEFGAGCLLARRLIESGVTFVEVGLGNWDTHQDNAAGVKRLTEQLDQPYAHLIADLKERGLLDNTLVIWMGEFGRTPRINPRGGRDHYPRAFSVALSGGGVKGGQVIGSTDAGGENVTDRPVTVQDLFQTFYKSLKIDAKLENMSPIGRPIKIVDGGKPVDEIFG